MPNFLIIGAARCGTTSLYSSLAEHPQVYLPANKRPEPHFFMRDSEYGKGLDYYASRYFADTGRSSMVGEASTSYIFSAAAASRIARDLPGVRLVLMLRHPVERAFSGYWHTVRSGLEQLPFEEAVADEDARHAAIDDARVRENLPFAYLGRGLYFKQLSRYLDCFTMDRVHVILFEDLVAAPAATFGAACRFLGIDADFQPLALGQVENASTPADASMTPALRARLVEYFARDVEQLAALLQRDLSKWMH